MPSYCLLVLLQLFWLGKTIKYDSFYSSHKYQLNLINVDGYRAKELCNLRRHFLRHSARFQNIFNALRKNKLLESNHIINICRI